MSQSTAVKICGISQQRELTALARAGCRYCGFVFFEKSPRHVTVQQAKALAQAAPVGVAKVALTVNADDAFLDHLVENIPLDMLQLHGSETPQRVLAVKKRYGLAVMKAVGVADADDLPALDSYAQVADQILVDAKAPKTAELPGGNGLGFDWHLIAGRRWNLPWMLAGGLTPENVALAMQMTGARQVDVSSGVEYAPGQKDPELIAKFAKAAGAHEGKI